MPESFFKYKKDFLVLELFITKKLRNKRFPVNFTKFLKAPVS